MLSGLGLSSTAKAQLVNNGATIKISAGAQLVCTGNLTNTSGTIDNDGTLQVQGSFSNSGTYSSASSSDVLQLTGTGNVTLNGGSSTYKTVVINKTGGGGVTLTGNFTVGTGGFTLTAGTFSTDPAQAYELRAPASAPFSFAAGTYINGKVRRTGWANGTSYMFNSPNMAITTNGGTAPTEMLVSMVAGGDPTDAEREVARKFNFSATGGSGYTADVKMPYAASELGTNTEANLVPWQRISGEWNAKTTGNTLDAGNDFITTTGIAAADLANEWKLADPRYTFNVTAFLRGAWNGTAMSTGLNSGGHLPLAHPYNTSPFNYTGTESVASIPNANVVDWVLVELRKPSSGLPENAGAASIIGRKVGFILSNGSIVETDGSTPISFDITKQGSGSFIAVRHRNHLGVLSIAKSSNSAGTFTNDFSALGNSYKATGASAEPMILLTGSTYGLWAGDANKNNGLNAIDINQIKTAVSNLLTGYQFQDVNMNGGINAIDVNLAKAMISTLGSSSLPARHSNMLPSNNNNTIMSNLPE